jgi:uroporphyrin-3 C-methyltransferase
MTESTPAAHTHRVTLLLALAGVAVAGYALWRVDSTRDRGDETRDRVQELEKANAAVRAELAAAADREAKTRVDMEKQWRQLAELPQQVKDLTASHDDLRARTERPQRAWVRAEALYLVELAQRRLSFDRDTATAIAALETADARLASLRDPSFASVRERIARDLQSLRAVPEPDRAGVSARLGAIEAQIDRLPLKGVLIGQPSIRSDDREPDSAFGRAWTRIGNALSTMFVVRKLRDGNANVVTLEEQTLRRQHLTLLAFAARHAVLRSDQAAYKASLDEMRNWIAQFFGESPAVDAVMHDLEALQNINIAPTLPTLSNAAQQLMRATPAPAQ